MQTKAIIAIEASYGAACCAVFLEAYESLRFSRRDCSSGSLDLVVSFLVFSD